MCKNGGQKDAKKGTSRGGAAELRRGCFRSAESAQGSAPGFRRGVIDHNTIFEAKTKRSNPPSVREIKAVPLTRLEPHRIDPNLVWHKGRANTSRSGCRSSSWGSEPQQNIVFACLTDDNILLEPLWGHMLVQLENRPVVLGGSAASKEPGSKTKGSENPRIKITHKPANSAASGPFSNTYSHCSHGQPMSKWFWLKWVPYERQTTCYFGTLIRGDS